MQIRLGDAVQRIGRKGDPRIEGVTRYVAGEHLRTDDLRVDFGDVTPEVPGPAFTTIFEPGAVLYGTRRTYLRKVGVVDFKGVSANTTLALGASGIQMLPDYLPWLMSSPTFVEFSVRASKGSVNPFVNWSDIANFRFELPSLSEQQRVVDEMRAVDQHIMTAEAVLTASRAYLASYISKSLEGVKSLPLHSAATFKRGYSYKSSDYGTDGADFITIKAISSDGVIRVDGMKKLSASVSKAAEFMVGPGALLVGLVDLTPARRILGAPILVPGGTTAAYSSDLIALSSSKRTSNDFLFYALQSAEARAFVEAHYTGSTVAHLGVTSMKNIPVRVPDSIEEQHLMIASFQKIEQLSNSSRAMIEGARSIRTSLLEELIG